MAQVDKLKILSGDSITFDSGITIRQPTIEEIKSFGEQHFFNTFYSLCSIPSDMKSVLWDAGIDFMKFSDWNLFLMISRNFNAQDTSLIFGDIDFASMQIMKITDTEDKVLVGENIIIDEGMYLEFIPYVREMIGYVLKREKAANKFTKMILIDEDRRKRQENTKPYSSTLEPIIISLVNTEEFPYTYSSVFELTIYQLLKSYYQIQNKKSACALYQGSMSGFVDTSKINKSAFQWIYDELKFQ